MQNCVTKHFPFFRLLGVNATKSLLCKITQVLFYYTMHNIDLFPSLSGSSACFFSSKNYLQHTHRIAVLKIALFQFHPVTEMSN